MECGSAPMSYPQELPDPVCPHYVFISHEHICRILHLRSASSSWLFSLVLASQAFITPVQSIAVFSTVFSTSTAVYDSGSNYQFTIFSLLQTLRSASVFISMRLCKTPLPAVPRFNFPVPRVFRISIDKPTCPEVVKCESAAGFQPLVVLQRNSVHLVHPCSID